MDNTIFPSLVLTITMASIATSSMAALRCPDCGQNPVPYPLSTGPSCGDQAYKVRCDEGTLWLDTLNQSSYMITSINPSTQRMILRPPGFARHDTCTSADIQSNGMWLDEDLPFFITKNNIIVKMNCSEEVLHEFEFICNSTSICKDYIRDNKEAANACAIRPGASNICCSYRAGHSVNAYRIRASPGRCTMYASFVDLDPMLPVSKWPEPGVEIQWALPLEPICKSPQDCKNLPDSTCISDLARDREMRCFCKAGYRWDPIHGDCYHGKCHFGELDERCEVPDIIEGIGFAAIISLLIVIIIFIIRRQNMQIGSHVKLEKTQDDLNCEQHVEIKGKGNKQTIFSKA